jgi:hypothetical protein
MTEKQAYKTMVEPRAEVIPQLAGWKRPKTAYILLEAKQYNLTSGGDMTPGYGLMTLDVEGRPEQMHRIDYYLKKGFRVLDYGNFPKLNDENPLRSARAELYSHGRGVNPWDLVARHLNTFAKDYDPYAKEKNLDLAKMVEEKEEIIRTLQARVRDNEAKETTSKNGEHQGRKGNQRANRIASAPSDDGKGVSPSEGSES